MLLERDKQNCVCPHRKGGSETFHPVSGDGLLWEPLQVSTSERLPTWAKTVCMMLQAPTVLTAGSSLAVQWKGGGCHTEHGWLSGYRYSCCLGKGPVFGTLISNLMPTDSRDISLNLSSISVLSGGIKRKQS